MVISWFQRAARKDRCQGTVTCKLLLELYFLMYHSPKQWPNPHSRDRDNDHTVDRRKSRVTLQRGVQTSLEGICGYFAVCHREVTSHKSCDFFISLFSCPCDLEACVEVSVLRELERSPCCLTENFRTED